MRRMQRRLAILVQREWERLVFAAVALAFALVLLPSLIRALRPAPRDSARRVRSRSQAPGAAMAQLSVVNARGLFGPDRPPPGRDLGPEDGSGSAGAGPDDGSVSDDDSGSSNGGPDEIPTGGNDLRRPDPVRLFYNGFIKTTVGAESAFITVRVGRAVEGMIRLRQEENLRGWRIVAFDGSHVVLVNGANRKIRISKGEEIRLP